MIGLLRLCVLAIFTSACAAPVSSDSPAKRVAFGNSSVSANPALLAADGTASSTLTVQLQDSDGSPRSGVSIQFSSTGSGVVFTQPSALTDSAGVVTGAVRATQAGTYQITIQGSENGQDLGLNLAATVQFLDVSAERLQLSLKALAQGPISLDDTTQLLITATLKTPFGIPLPKTSVSFASLSGFGALSAPRATTDANGTASIVLSTTTAGAVRLQATATNARPATATANFLAGAPNAAMSTVVLVPDSAASDANSPITLTAVLRDQFGNPTPNVPVAAQITDANIILPATSPNTDVQGRWVSTFLSGSPSLPQVAIQSGNVILSVAPRFGLGLPSALKSHVVVPPMSIVADNQSPAYLTMVVEDQNGTLLQNVWVNWTVSGTNNSLTLPAGPTADDGAMATVLYSNVAEQKQVFASVGNLTAMQNIVFVAGPPDATQSSFLIWPPVLNLSSSQNATLVATLRDAFGNLCPEVSMVFDATGTNIALSPNNPTSDANGQARAVLQTTTAEVKTLTATVGSVVLSGSLTVNAGSPNIATSRLNLRPSSGVIADLQSPLAVQFFVADMWGNPVVNQNVYLLTSGEYNDVRLPAGGATDGNGVWTSNVVSRLAATKKISVGAASISLMANTTFVAGPAAQANSSASSAPLTMNAALNNNFRTSAHFADKFNNICSQQNVVSTLVYPDNTVNTVNLVTDTLGNLNTTRTGLTQAGQYAFALASGKATFSSNFTVQRLATSQLTVTAAEPTSGFTSDITVAATDVFGNADPNFSGTVSFSVTDPNASVPAAYTFSSADKGQHVFVGGMHFLRPGVQTVSVSSSSPNLSGSQNVFVRRPLGPLLTLMSSVSGTPVCLAPQSEHASGQTPLLSTDCDGHLAQGVRQLSDGTLRLLNQCVDSPGGAAPGQNVVLMPCSYAPTQMWQLSNQQLVSGANGNVCLNLPSITGQAVQTTSCADANTTLLTKPAAAKTVFFINDTNQAVVSQGQNFSAGTPIVSALFSGSGGLELYPDDTLRFNKTACLDLNGSLNANTSLSVSNCSASAPTAWLIDGDLIHPKNANSLCVDASSGTSQPLRLATCSGAPTQSFTALQFGPIMQLHQAAPADTKSCVQLASNFQQDADPLGLDICTAAATQRLATLAGSADGTTGFQLFFPYDSLMAKMDQNTALQGGNAFSMSSLETSQQMTLLPHFASSAFAISPLDQSTLCLDSAASSSTGGMVFATKTGASTQAFQWSALSVAFSPSTQTGLCLSAYNPNRSVSFAASFAACSSTAEQSFEPTALPPDASGQIASPLTVGGRCLDANTQGLSPNTVGLSPCNESLGQSWWMPFGEGTLQNGLGSCIAANQAASGNAVLLGDCNAANQNMVQRLR